MIQYPGSYLLSGLYFAITIIAREGEGYCKSEQNQEYQDKRFWFGLFRFSLYHRFGFLCSECIMLMLACFRFKETNTRIQVFRIMSEEQTPVSFTACQMRAVSLNVVCVFPTSDSERESSDGLCHKHSGKAKARMLCRSYRYRSLR